MISLMTCRALRAIARESAGNPGAGSTWSILDITKGRGEAKPSTGAIEIVTWPSGLMKPIGRYTCPLGENGELQ